MSNESLHSHQWYNPKDLMIACRWTSKIGPNRFSLALVSVVVNSCTIARASGQDLAVYPVHMVDAGASLSDTRKDQKTSTECYYFFTASPFAFFLEPLWATKVPISRHHCTKCCTNREFLAEVRAIPPVQDLGFAWCQHEKGTRAHFNFFCTFFTATQ